MSQPHESGTNDLSSSPRSADSSVAAVPMTQLPVKTDGPQHTHFVQLEEDDNTGEGEQHSTAAGVSVSPGGGGSDDEYVEPSPKPTRGSDCREMLATAWKGVRLNMKPGLILQAMALFIVFLYYTSPNFSVMLQSLAEWKNDLGYSYSAIATSIFGGVIPYALIVWSENRQLRRQAAESNPETDTAVIETASDRTVRRVKEALFYVLFWALRGVEVEYFYELQARWFGVEVDAGTIIKKVLVDQFVYCPIWAVWIVSVAFMWKDTGFSVRQTCRKFDRRFFLFTIPCTLIAIWGVWIPAVAIIYMLPSSLQLVLMNFVLCFWTLLMTFLSKNTR